MKALITSTVASKLISIVRKYKADVAVPQPGNWKSKGDGALWASVLVQIAVVGAASGGDTLAGVLEHEDEWYRQLASFTPMQRVAEIHLRLRQAGVRYASDDVAKCKKTAAAAYDFEVLASYEGPKNYFKNIAAIPFESWRIAVVADDLAYVKNKGARDLLIGLGLVERAIAFDSRLVGVLKHLGVDVPDDLATNKPRYKALESELIAKVCGPCGITGGHLDRILFSRAKEIVV